LNLAIDIGNTRTKLGIFEDSKLVQKYIWNNEEWSLNELKVLLKKKRIQHVALSTVKESDKVMERYLLGNFYYLNLSSKTPLPIDNFYKTPKTLGKDRLAAVLGAYELFPEKNVLVIDAGTCIKYDVLTADGAYQGGNISPGLNMRFEAMHTFTAKLPLVKRRKQMDIVGQNTVTSLRIGGQWGAILEMEGFISQYRARFGKINVILTGGDAEFFAFYLKTKIFVNINLVLIGLNKILKYNVQQSE